MKTEQEIVLQKKMIIIFSMVILAFVMGILNIKKTEAKLSIQNDENTKKYYTVYDADRKYFTVEKSGEILEKNDNVESNQSGDKEVITEEQKVTEESIIAEASALQEEPQIEQPEKVVSRGSYMRETSAPPTEYERVITVKATAYCLCTKCCGKSPSSPSYGNTASGLKIIPNTGMKVIAVDPNVVPLGTEVYIEGLNGAANYGYAIAADTGSAIKNNKIDLYMDTHVKTVNMYILGE